MISQVLIKEKVQGEKTDHGESLFKREAVQSCKSRKGNTSTGRVEGDMMWTVLLENQGLQRGQSMRNVRR